MICDASRIPKRSVPGPGVFYRGWMRRTRPVLATVFAVLLSACAPAGPGADTPAPGTEAGGSGPEAGGPEGDTTTPELQVEVVADGLSLPWDVALLPDGTAVVGERGGRLIAIPEDGPAREVPLDLPGFFTGSEAGLMGLAVEDEGSLLACYATEADGAPQDVRVARVDLAEDRTSAAVEEVLVSGLPITSGRHSGCRLLLVDGVLYVGTGDAADESTPQALDSLGGKVLAVDLAGGPLPEAPFVEGADPRILTYGHRNVQGLAARPGTGQVWSAEHGPDVDDEVNLLVPGGNYGWDPGPGYDERVPMTDLDSFPDAVEAAWSTGRPTRALAGAAFLQGSAWRGWEGALAVAELKGSGVTVLSLEGDVVVAETRIAELDGDHGRLRSLRLADDGSLWVTTSNGTDDRVLRVTPRP